MKPLYKYKYLSIPVLFVATQAFSQTADPSDSQNQDDQGVIPLEIAVEDIAIDESASALNQLVNFALRKHPRISSRRNTLEAAIADYEASKGGYLPQVNFELSAGGEYLDPDDRGLHETASAEFTVTQMLYDGQATRSSVASAQQIATLRYYELEETISDMALSIVNAYENVVRYRRLLELSKDSYRLHYNIHQQVSQRVASGAAPRVNLEQMEGRLALAESNLMVEASNLRDHIIRYQNLVGQAPSDDITLTEFDEAYWPDSLSEMLDTAYQRSAFLLAATSDVNVRESNVQQARSESRPEVFIRGRQGWYHNAGGFDSRNTDVGSRSSIELVLSMNLFTGGTNSSRTNAAIATLGEAQDSQLDICLDLRQRVERAYFERVRLGEQMAFFQSHERAADEVRGAYRAQFEIGQRSLLEILDIETEYLDAAQARINGEHDLNLAIANGLHHSGLLVEALGLKGRILPELQALDLVAPRQTELQYCQSQPSLEDLTLENLLATLETPLGASTIRTELASGLPVETLSTDVVFETGTADFTPAGRTLVNRFEQRLGSDDAILVEVHTDSQGSAGRNQLLSQARADAIRALLVDAGIAAERIYSVGLGSSQPIEANTSDAGREANRRVELYVKEPGSSTN